MRTPLAPRAMMTLALAALPLLAGCSTYRGVESPNQAVVQRTDYSFDVAVDGYGLAPGENQRLAGWLATMRPAYGDKIALDDPSASPAIRSQVEAEAGKYGLLIVGYAPVTPGAIAPGTARVVLTRLVAGVPKCPNQAGYDTINFDAHTSSNFGCAINGNLAAMVANPGDLVRGQPGTDTADPATAVKAIDSYRKATPTGGGGTTVKGAGTGGSSSGGGN